MGSFRTSPAQACVAWVVGERVAAKQVREDGAGACSLSVGKSVGKSAIGELAIQKASHIVIEIDRSAILRRALQAKAVYHLSLRARRP